MERNDISVEVCYTTYGPAYIVRAGRYTYSQAYSLHDCVFGGTDIPPCPTSGASGRCFEVDGNIVRIYASGEVVEEINLW